MISLKDSYHFVGIGGVGMSSLARLLLEKKIRVSGSDKYLSQRLEELERLGAQIHIEPKLPTLEKETVVVCSSAISKQHPSVLEARSKGCRLIHRSELLKFLGEGKEQIAITGTHGKTSQTALLVEIFQQANLSPSFSIGADFKGVNGASGQGPFFIFEVDESDGSFLRFFPKTALIPSLEWDHIDYYSTQQALVASVEQFVSQVQKIYYCGESSLLFQIVGSKGISYGRGEQFDAQISELFFEKEFSFFTLFYKGIIYPKVQLNSLGEHQVLNAVGAVICAIDHGIDEKTWRAALKNFSGVSRRCEIKAQTPTLTFMDDYAHHPTEVRLTLKAIKQKICEKRLVVVFQPHRFSRTKTFLKEFSTSFEWADFVLVDAIYGVGEPFEPNLKETLIQEIGKNCSVPVLPYKGEEQLKEILRPFDVCLSMGAGSCDKMHTPSLHAYTPRPWRVALFFGGQSTEHAISLVTARFLRSSLKEAGIEVFCVAIGRCGGWCVDPQRASDYLEEKIKDIPFESPYQALSFLEKIDCCFPCFHGPFGEDGVFHSLFEILNKPYIGTSPLSGALCMNKKRAKQIALSAGVPTPPFEAVTFFEWKLNPEKFLDKVRTHLALPLFVKPNHLGSSIGIYKIEKWEDLFQAIEKAFSLDSEVLVEQGIENARELEFPIIGNSNGFDFFAPIPGEKLARGAFVDYEKKYIPGNLQTTIDPEFIPEILEKGRFFAKSLYKALDCQGYSRIDFLLDSQGQWWFFDANPIPGMNPLSISPKVWKREGLDPKDLVKKLLLLGLESHRIKQRTLLGKELMQI